MQGMQGFASAQPLFMHLIASSPTSRLRGAGSTQPFSCCRSRPVFVAADRKGLEFAIRAIAIPHPPILSLENFGASTDAGLSSDSLSVDVFFKKKKNQLPLSDSPVHQTPVNRHVSGKSSRTASRARCFRTSLAEGDRHASGESPTTTGRMPLFRFLRDDATGHGNTLARRVFLRALLFLVFYSCNLKHMPLVIGTGGDGWQESLGVGTTPVLSSVAASPRSSLFAISKSDKVVPPPRFAAGGVLTEIRQQGSQGW
ncbi:hypothetical protein VTI74DRAFT_5497 [Chaetomium olivicolor]